MYVAYSIRGQLGAPEPTPADHWVIASLEWTSFCQSGCSGTQKSLLGS